MPLARVPAAAAAAVVTKDDTKEKTDKKSKKDKKDKESKKDKKEKRRSETDGVHKHKDKKDKHKEKKLAQALEAHLQADAAAANDQDDSAMADAPTDGAALVKRPKKTVAAARVPKPIVQGALVEFALPLAADKLEAKVFSMVKRAAKAQALLRGVKEVNKALRRAPAKNPSAASVASVPGVVVIAADVNPAEVVMHLPLACEDVNAPYVFVASRGLLGVSARTKRPTSVVLLKAEGRMSKKPASTAADSDDDGTSYTDTFRDFVKTVQKEYAKQMKGII